MEKIEIDGKFFEGYSIPTEHSCILLVKAARGFLGCGYFSLATAEKTGDALAVVTGVKNFDEMLAAKVKAASPAAGALGVTTDMTGREALLKLV